MSKIVVDIECGSKICVDCVKNRELVCQLFNSPLATTLHHGDGYNVRCPACLSAESQLKALVDAAKIVRGFVYPESFMRDDLDKALEPFVGNETNFVTKEEEK